MNNMNFIDTVENNLTVIIVLSIVGIITILVFRNRNLPGTSVNTH